LLADTQAFVAAAKYRSGIMLAQKIPDLVKVHATGERGIQVPMNHQQ
jgi:hypothetical protein